MSYIIVTPAHNEAEFLPGAIDSVLSQTVLPSRWIIVDDGSTDATASIVRSYATKSALIQYLPLARDVVKTYYARRVHVFLAGYEAGRVHEHEYVAALDADITLPRNYYQRLLGAFAKRPKLGIASGVYVDMIDGKPQKMVRDRELEHTPGAIQVFRRACYEQIGGYKPLPYGGDDSLSNLEAMKHGWETQSYEDTVAYHYRPVGTRGSSIYRARFRQGKAERDLGSPLAFMLAKTLRRAVKEKPYLIGSLARFAGYCAHSFSREPSVVSADTLAFARQRQMARVRGLLGLKVDTR